MPREPTQSPSTGESTKDQKKQEPAPVDVTKTPNVSRSGASVPRQTPAKGPKSGGMGPKQ